MLYLFSKGFKLIYLDGYHSIFTVIRKKCGYVNFLPMQYFIAVDQHKGISNAAKELHITQQTLSAHMAALEKELGCTLFTRRPHFELTYAGRRFLEYARSFCGEYDSMRREFADIGSNESGIVHVGIAHTRSSTILPDIIAEFQQRYPLIQIASNEQTNSRILDALRAGERDIAIARFDTSAPEFSARTLYSEDVLLVVSKKLIEIDGEPKLDESASARLSDIPFFMSSNEDITGRIGSAFLRKSGLNPPIKAYSDNAATLLSLCVRGLGACFCPNKLLYATLSHEQLASVHVLSIGEQYDIQIAHRAGAYLSRPAALFEEFCLNYFAKPTSAK